jgi:hypothetical protein
MEKDDNPRLGRIESKLDKLSDAIVSLARMEERMITLFKRMDSYDSYQKKLDDRVDELEEISQGRGHFLRLFERVFWIVITAAVGSVFWIVKSTLT